jgi:hypothetical protein
MTAMVRNHLAQPVELHLASRTVVVAPYADAELSDAETQSEHVRHLSAAGHLSVQAAPEAAAPVEPASSPRAPAAKADRRARVRTAKKVTAHSGKD